MRLLRFVLAAVLLTVFLLGCGGGGGGGGSAPSPTGNLIVQLQDKSSLPVDGIVSLDGASPRATSSGQVKFSDVSSGAHAVTVSVNGQTTAANVMVTAGATSTAKVTVSGDSFATPQPTTPPGPPF